MKNDVRGVEVLVFGSSDVRVWAREVDDFGSDVGRSVRVREIRAATYRPHVRRIVGVVVGGQVDHNLLTVAKFCEGVVVDVFKVCCGGRTPSVNVEAAVGRMYFSCKKHVSKGEAVGVECSRYATVQELT